MGKRGRRKSNLRLDSYSNENKYNDVLVNYNPINEEYINIKNYIIYNFIEPLKNKNFVDVQNNFYNFEYIQAKLDTFDVPKLASEIDLLKQIIIVMKAAVETRFVIDKNRKKMYGDIKMNTLFKDTSRIVLMAKYEVYNAIYGNPKLNSIETQYDRKKLKKIQDILNNTPGITIKNIKRILNENNDL